MASLTKKGASLFTFPIPIIIITVLSQRRSKAHGLATVTTPAKQNHQNPDRLRCDFLTQPKHASPPLNDSVECDAMIRMPAYRITPSPFPLDPGLSMLPSSAPLPLCPRFRPVMLGRWKPWCAGAVAGSVLAPGFSEANSPNRDKKVLFLGFASSLRPTSSKPSSSVAPGFSNVLWLTADLGKRAARESNEPRDG
jgi:hypothetical protein